MDLAHTKGRFRRYLIHHFLYAVIYAIEDDTISASGRLTFN
jgi:hypothetical protein